MFVISIVGYRTQDIACSEKAYIKRYHHLHVNYTRKPITFLALLPWHSDIMTIWRSITMTTFSGVTISCLVYFFKKHICNWLKYDAIKVDSNKYLILLTLKRNTADNDVAKELRMNSYFWFSVMKFFLCRLKHLFHQNDWPWRQRFRNYIFITYAKFPEKRTFLKKLVFRKNLHTCKCTNG